MGDPESCSPTVIAIVAGRGLSGINASNLSAGGDFIFLSHISRGSS